MIKRILAVALLAVAIPGEPQEIRRPRARRIPGAVTETPTATATPTPTATATPTPPADPCSECPAPDSFSCTIAWTTCVRCWEECGQPIATPTPTPTATPPPTPTPNGPACEVNFSSPSDVYLVAYYAHESPIQGKRYSYQTAPASIPSGSTVRPCPCEGSPIGFEWRAVTDNRILKSCGDTSSIFFHIFADGFESGSTSEWSETTP